VALQTKSHEPVALQIAAALLGALQGVHELPHELGESLARHWLAHLW
jgi:hypothetical protein